MLFTILFIYHVTFTALIVATIYRLVNSDDVLGYIFYIALTLLLAFIYCVALYSIQSTFK